MANAARTPTEADLRRLGALAEKLYVQCEFAGMDGEPQQEFDWRPVRRRLSELAARMFRERIEAGHLLDVAEDLVHPTWGCCCGLRFLALAADYLDPLEVERLKAWAESKDALDEDARIMAELTALSKTIGAE